MPQGAPAGRLALVELPGDAAALAREGLLDGTGTTRLALSPAAVHELEARGLDYALPHAFAPSRALQAELEPNWGRLAALTAALGEEGGASAYALKILLDSPMEKVVHLAEAFRALRPAEIAWRASRPSSFDHRLLYDEAESLYARLVPAVAAAHAPTAGLQVVEPAAVPPAPALRTWKARLRRMAAPAVRRLRAALARTPTAKPIVLVETGYGLEDILAALPASHPVVRWRPGGPLDLPPGWGGGRGEIRAHHEEALDEARARWRAVREDRKVRDLFEIRGVPFFDEIAARLERAATRDLPATATVRHVAERWLRGRSLAVASVFFSDPYTYGVALGARRAGVPVITLQHSSYGESRWETAKHVDGVMSDYKIVGGAGTARYVETVERSGVRPVPTGLPRLDRLLARRRSAGERTGPTRVLYPLTSYVRNAIMYSNRRLAVTEYFETNRRILAALAETAEAEIVVRPHPGTAFLAHVAALRGWAAARGWRNVRFELEGDGFDAMQDADLIVIDSPSTVFLDAAATDVPILVYNPIFPMTEEGLAAVLRRAGYAEDLDEFVELIRLTLRKGVARPPPPADRTFVELYGVPEPGRSAARAAEALARIVEGRGP